MKTLVIVSTLVLSSVAFAADSAPTPAPDKVVGSTLEQHLVLKPGELKWIDGPPALAKGAKMVVIEGDPAAPNALFTLRLKLPDGFQIQPHFHPADEHVTVLSGTINMGTGDVFDKKNTTALGPGSYSAMPKGHHHFSWAKGETILQVHAVGPWAVTYLTPADDPRNAKTK